MGHRRSSLASALTLTAGLALGLVLPAAAAGAARAPADVGRRTLSVAVAASLKPAAEALGRGFEAEHPGVAVVLTTGASGALAAQIREGAPFDLLLSADRDYPARLVEAGLARAEDERVYALGGLVAWTPPGATLDLERRGLAALADPAVRRVAIANPAVAPYGRAAERALEAAGVLDAVRGKLVLGTSVAQAAQFATTGAADAALLPRSLVSGPALSAGRWWAIPRALAPPVEQSAVVVSGAREAELARAFLAWLGGEKGRAVLLKYGYGLP